MNQEEKRSLIGFFFVFIIVVGLNFVGGQHSLMVMDAFPLFTMVLALIFIIQLIAFVPAYMFRTEKFFDLVGSFTYLSAMGLALYLLPERDGRSWLLFVLILIWAIRLGLFLYQRVHKAGSDSRFDQIKQSFIRFFVVWMLQGLWVSFTLSAALMALSSLEKRPLGLIELVGVLIWVIGFSIEVIADRQKSAFRSDPQNKDRFIQTGLWAYSRHPNYFGEIMLWVGIGVISFPVFVGWQWVMIISPVFVYLLLTRISGIPLLEKKADEKWGGEPDYELYKENTSVLWLRAKR